MSSVNYLILKTTPCLNGRISEVQGYLACPRHWGLTSVPGSSGGSSGRLTCALGLPGNPDLCCWLVGKAEGKKNQKLTMEALLRKYLFCLFRLSHRNYLLESPHKFSVADLQQVSMLCFPPLNLRLTRRFLILKKITEKLYL